MGAKIDLAYDQASRGDGKIIGECEIRRAKRSGRCRASQAKDWAFRPSDWPCVPSQIRVCSGLIDECLIVRSARSI